MKKTSILLLTVMLMFMGAAASLRASEVTVGVSLFDLTPGTVNIKSGDIVHWVDADGMGDYFISGPFGNGAVPCGVRLWAPGSYPYYAGWLYGGTWSGTINVSAVDAPPFVAITSPTNGAVFTAPATVAFEADATDPDPNDIWDVEFWVGDTLVDDIFYPPFTTTLADLPAGTYTLKAVAWDYSDVSYTNSIVITVVNPGPITLSSAAWTGTNLIFHASGLVIGKTNVVECSTNMIDWWPVQTNVADGTSQGFTNTPAGRVQFFRMVQVQ
jgi:Big-like domain-containing protein